MSATTDVVVVGGGLAGLSAATYLARGGVSVTLFEKAAEAGGRAATQTYEGYSFNRGAHALYYGGAATQVLRELGVAIRGGNPSGVLGLRGGRLYPLPATLTTLLRTPLLDAADKLELARLLLALGVPPAPRLARVSVRAWLDTHVRRPRVRQALTAIAHTFAYSAALDQVSMEVIAAQMRLSFMHPVVYLDGGWQTLVAGLRQAATAAGARIVSGTRVEALTHREDRVDGVRLADGTVVRASAVILAVPPADAARLAGSAAPALGEVLSAGRPVQVTCLDVALRHLPAPQHPVVFDLDQARFLTVQSLFAQITPPGGALIHTLKYLDPARPSDPHDDERALEDLLDTAQPGWRSVLVKRITLPRIEAVSWLPTAQGGGFAGRPGVRAPGLAGLYLAGDWVGPTGYLADAALASARQVARHLLTGDLATLRAAAPAPLVQAA